MQKIALIIPYLGKFPDMIHLWMKSCAYNPTVDFIIYTDTQLVLNAPNNVRLLPVTYESLKEKIKNTVGFDVSLEKPYKLCDFRPAYGEIFKDDLFEYDFWGYCDIDLIFGDIRKYIPEYVLDRYDKIFSLGHFTLYRNTPFVNALYRSTNDYKTIFTVSENCHFDEGMFEDLIPVYQERKLNPVWLYDRQFNINTIFRKNNIQLYVDFDCIADINLIEDHLRLTKMSCLSYKDSHAPNSIFVWNNGKLYRYYLHGKEVKREEFMYIHLQKRQMINRVDDLSCNSFYITKHEFLPANSVLDYSFLKGQNKNCLSASQRKKKIVTLIKHSGHKFFVSVKRHTGVDLRHLFGRK